MVMIFRGLSDSGLFFLEGQERIVLGTGETAAVLFVREKCDEQKCENQAEKNSEWNNRHGVEWLMLLSASRDGGLRTSCPTWRSFWRMSVSLLLEPVLQVFFCSQPNFEVTVDRPAFLLP